MSCMAHSMNNITKSLLSSHCHGPDLEVVEQDFWSMKRIVEDGNWSGWHDLLPTATSCYKSLKQDLGHTIKSQNDF